MFLPNLAWNATHEWSAILFQIRHGLGSQATIRSFLEFAGGLLGGAGVVALPLGIWQLARGRGSASLRVAAATLVPIAVTAVSAFRGPVEANWGALVYPALCGAGAAALLRLRPAWSQGLLAFTVGLGLLFAVGFGLEVRNPTLIPPDSEVMKRFRGWPEFAKRARAAAEQACTSIGSPPGCNPADPFVYPSSYQDAAELAFYAGWTRFGPASQRPVQLDLWDAAPPDRGALPDRRGDSAGATPVSRGGRRRACHFRGAAEGPGAAGGHHRSLPDLGGDTPSARDGLTLL